MYINLRIREYVAILTTAIDGAFNHRGGSVTRMLTIANDDMRFIHPSLMVKDSTRCTYITT